MAYTTEQQAANRRKWVAALRSGDYKQAKESLVVEDDDKNRSYCCLGVACVLAISEGIEDDFPDQEYADWDEQLTPDIRDWLGLQSKAGDLTAPVAGKEHLIGLNDEANLTFAEIADVIESGKVKLQGRVS